MKRSVVGLSFIAFISISSSLSADTLVGPGGAFQPWTASVLGPASAPTYGGPYWNNFSGDGAAANIGWCLTGGGSCIIKSPPGAIAYWGNGMNAVTNMSLHSNGYAITVSLLGINTNQKGGTNGIDYFGWYAINPDGSIGAMTQLWSSTSAVNSTTATFMPTANYGFYLENVQGGGAADYFWLSSSGADYSSGPNKNPIDGLQHFTIFSGTPGIFYLGINDTNNGDRDFNDMIVQVTSAPEPSTVALVALAGLLLAFLVRKGASPARA